MKQWETELLGTKLSSGCLPNSGRETLFLLSEDLIHFLSGLVRQKSPTRGPWTGTSLCLLGTRLHSAKRATGQ